MFVSRPYTISTPTHANDSERIRRLPATKGCFCGRSWTTANARDDRALTLHGGGRGFESPRLHFRKRLFCRTNLTGKQELWSASRIYYCSAALRAYGHGDRQVRLEVLEEPRVGCGANLGRPDGYSLLFGPPRVLEPEPVSAGTRARTTTGATRPGAPSARGQVPPPPKLSWAPTSGSNPPASPTAPVTAVLRPASGGPSTSSASPSAPRTSRTKSTARTQGSGALWLSLLCVLDQCPFTAAVLRTPGARCVGSTLSPRGLPRRPR
jgi:hypothetical protein